MPENSLPSAPSPDDVPTFEVALEKLGKIVGQLEEGRLGLAESLASYEDGVKLLRQCFDQLQAAEHRIQLLSGLDEAGRPVVTPFDHQAMDLDEKSANRSRRRSANSVTPPSATPRPGGETAAGGR